MKKYNLAPTLLAAALVGTPVAAFAQNSEPAIPDAAPPAISDMVQPVQVTGTVAEVDAGVLVLQSGQSVFLSNDTVIKDDAAVAGAMISVSGYPNLVDGSIEATQITAQ